MKTLFFSCFFKGALIDGAANPAPEQWGKTTEEERGESGIGSWPGVSVDIKPPNAVLKLYGGAAFERVIHEFRCAAYSIECPPVSREKVYTSLFFSINKTMLTFYRNAKLNAA